MKTHMAATDSYVIFPRQIVSDFLAGRLSKPELLVYYWLRQNGDPYGKVRMSLSELRGFYPSNVSENFINKVLLSLKGKRYIYYAPRAGRRGPFEIEMGEWILPNKGGIKSLNKFFAPLVRPEETSRPPLQSEPAPRDEARSQIPEHIKSYMNKRFPPINPTS